MRLYIDLATNKFVNDPNFKAGISSVDFKRGDASTVEIQFIDGNEPASLAEDSLIRFGIKADEKFDGDFLVFADSYSVEGDNYILAPSFNTETLNDELNSGDSDDSNDLASLETMLEITWSEDDGNTWKSSNTITANIFNDVIKGEEGTPTELPNPEDYITERAVRYDEAQSLSIGEQIQARENIDAESPEGAAQKVSEHYLPSLSVTEDPLGEGGYLHLSNSAIGTLVEPDATLYSIFLPAGLENDIRKTLAVRAIHTNLSVYTHTGNFVGQIHQGSQQRFRASKWIDSETDYLEWEPVGFISSMVNSVVNLISTIAGSKIFTGQLRATGQTATTSDALMTRSLVDSRNSQNPARIRRISNYGVHSGDGGIAVSGDNGSVGSGVSATGWAKYSIRNLDKFYSITGGTISAESDWEFSFCFGNYQGFINQSSCFLVGTDANTPPFGASDPLTGKGYGLQIRNNGGGGGVQQIRLVAYDTGFTASGWATSGGFGFYGIRLRKVGTTLELYQTTSFAEETSTPTLSLNSAPNSGNLAGNIVAFVATNDGINSVAQTNALRISGDTVIRKL